MFFGHLPSGLQVLQNGRTLNGCLSVAAFSKLQRLELHCVPLHYVYGLSSLRSTLRHLVCIGCFETLQVSHQII
jgi:hypothetical protein